MGTLKFTRVIPADSIHVVVHLIDMVAVLADFGRFSLGATVGFG